MTILPTHSPKASLRLLCLLSFLLLMGRPVLLTSQSIPTYLNERYYRSMNAKASLAIGNDSYYLASSVNIRPWEYQYTRVNHHGVVLDTLNLVFNDTINWFQNGPKCLHYHHGRVYNAYMDFVSNDSGYVILSKLPGDLSDTLMTRNLHLFGYFGLQVYAMAFDSDSTFILSGHAARWQQGPTQSVLKYDLLVARFDTNLRPLWVRTVPDSLPNENYGPVGSHVEIDAYGGVLVSGSPYFYAWTKPMGFAARLDRRSGALRWYREYSGDHGIKGMYALDNGDGTFQFVQNWVMEPSGSANFVNLGEMDTLGNILWQRKIGEPLRANFCRGLIATADGNYYTAGQAYEGEFHGFGLKFSRQGDSLWYREYWHEMPGDHSWIGTFYERPDSGFIHGGYFFNLKTVPRDNRLYYWLFGTDKYGCDSAGCHTIGLAEQYQDLQLQVFPNPSRGRFLLSGDLARLGRGAQLRLYDLSGRERASATLPSEAGAKAEFHFDLAPGLYFAQITAGDGRPVAVLRWVVEP